MANLFNSCPEGFVWDPITESCVKEDLISLGKDLYSEYTGKYPKLFRKGQKFRKEANQYLKVFDTGKRIKYLSRDEEKTLLQNLKKQITTILDEAGLILTNNWGQLYKQGDFHEPHTHGNSFYSGILYVDGQGDDGTNFFDNYSQEVYQEKFKANTLILFPSQIIHFVKYQKEDNGRIIISFNTEKKKC